MGDVVKVDIPDNVDETTMRKIKRGVDDEEYDDGEDDDNGHHPHPNHEDDNDDVDETTVLNLGFEGLSQDDKLLVQEV